MTKPAARIIFLQGLFAVGAIVIVWRSVVLQVVQHAGWRERARRESEANREIPAARGTIYDRTGVPLALSQPHYRVQIALDQVVDRRALQALIPRVLGVSRARVAAQFTRRYPYFYGPFSAEEVEPLRAIRGVHLESFFQRVYPMGDLARPILGRLDQDGTHGIEGIEKALDTVLTGRAGVALYMRDGAGRILAAPGTQIRGAVPGRDVYLTIHHELQSIAEGALERAVAEFNAHGGDIVMLDVRTGELLAIASLRTDSATQRLVPNAGALIEPNEPGSTSKLFTAAAVLRTGADTTPVFAEHGRWRMPVSANRFREIEDTHAEDGDLTLGEVIRVSSNIGISKFALRLTPEQQFGTLRDFGFGTLPPIDFPGLSAGRLVRPARWANARYTMPSLAQGYEWMATAVQLAAGYATIANHGRLMETSLVEAIRAGDSTVWEERPREIRQVIPASVADRLIQYLTLATDSGGTGTRARLDRIAVIGKTGTAEIRPYTGGNYRASFAGLFPGDDPRLVVYVMIDRPRGAEHFGGLTAAPTVRALLQQALVSAGSPLEMSRFMVARGGASSSGPVPPPAVPGTGAVAVSLPVPVARAAPEAPVQVPEVKGSAVREGVRLLLAAGLEVRVRGSGLIRTTIPASGDSLPRGSVVTLVADSTR